MIREQTKEKLSAMKMRGMLSALEQWEKGAGAKDLSPLDLLGLLVDTEWTERENRRYTQLRRQARFPMAAAVEEIDYQHPRSLKKPKMLELISCGWIAQHQNLILSGATGVGKTYLTCALGEKACREGYKVLYLRAPRLFGDLYQAKADGSYRRLLERLAKTHLLIIDDLGCAALEGGERQDLREILEDRYSVSSTIVTSQFDPKDWHSFIGDETLADAICDRLVHNAHHLALKGDSMRKKKGLKAGSGE
jgi:DNA replication protein DnaC